MRKPRRRPRGLSVGGGIFAGIWFGRAGWDFGVKILVVTHNYAPDRAPRAFRWTAIAEHWAATGLHVDVVTSGRTGGAAYEVVNGVHVHRVGEQWNGRFRRRF